MDDASAIPPPPPPKLVFIVPYRDRIPHKTFFTHYTESVIMRDYIRDRDYAVYFAHQRDARPFNRGAMKNIGFLAIKYKYPADYKDITFVFNDIDTVPYDRDVLRYETQRGTIKHFYGFVYALGGIFSVKGSDFERIGGFPNFWAWGCEDNCIYNRAITAGITVDRSTFFPIGDQRILQRRSHAWGAMFILLMEFLAMNMARCLARNCWMMK